MRALEEQHAEAEEQALRDAEAATKQQRIAEDKTPMRKKATQNSSDLALRAETAMMPEKPPNRRV